MKFLIPGALLISFSLAAHAQGNSTRSPTFCEVLGKQIADKIGGAVDSQLSGEFQISLRVKDASDLKVACSSDQQQPSSIFIRTESANPTAAFYKLLADAGRALTGLSLRRLNKGAHNCHRASLGAIDGRSNKGVRRLSFECHTSESFSTFRFYKTS